MAYLNNHHSKIYNMVQLGQKAGQRIKQASQFASTTKRIYDNGRMIYNAARTIAPIVATGLSLQKIYIYYYYINVRK